MSGYWEKLSLLQEKTLHCDKYKELQLNFNYNSFVNDLAEPISSRAAAAAPIMAPNLITLLSMKLNCAYTYLFAAKSLETKT